MNIKISLLVVGALLFVGLHGLSADVDPGGAQLQPNPPQYQANSTTIEIVYSSPDKQYPISYSNREWQERLSGFEYKILRRNGTERAYSGELNFEKRPGIYYSRATGQPLFSSEHKYESGTGWPSFWRPITLDAVDYIADRSFFMTRTELVDSSSGSHLGHVFTDGPLPTGLRYCINSASLLFVPAGEEPPAIVRDYANGS